MNSFATPAWEVDEQGEKLSKSVFDGDKTTKAIKKRKRKPKLSKKPGPSPDEKANPHSGEPSDKTGSAPTFSKNAMRRHKRRLQQKLLKKSLSNSVGVLDSNSTLAENKTEAMSNSTIKKSRKRKNKKPKLPSQNEEVPEKTQSKLEKLLEVRKKRKRARKMKQTNQSSDAVPSDTVMSPISQTTPQSKEQKKLKAKLKRKERRHKKKEELVAKKELEAKANINQDTASKAIGDNEVVVTNKKKRKMRKKILKQASANNLKNGMNGQGTANPCFDSSLSESVGPEENQTTKKKRNRRKKKVIDSVDGNLVTTSRGLDLTPNNKGGQVVSSNLAVSDDMPGEPPKKKLVVAKLLEEADIVESTTLHNLKKNRRSGKKQNIPTPLRERMTEQLKSARFRWINEQLYSSNSWDALKFFKDDPEAYEAYHSGYRNQVAQWPINPIDIIIQSLSSFPKETVVADFGCGEARLAESLPNLKVHSLDLVASKPGVTACDMAHTPLLLESVDVAVFCLSLMGTNLNDFILEANRVLKTGGLLLIAEVESRFEDVDNFTSAMVHFGFNLKKKDLSNQMFIFLDFKKSKKVSKTGKLPVLSLDACVYKKR